MVDQGCIFSILIHILICAIIMLRPECVRYLPGQASHRAAAGVGCEKIRHKETALGITPRGGFLRYAHNFIRAITYCYRLFVAVGYPLNNKATSNRNVNIVFTDKCGNKE